MMQGKKNFIFNLNALGLFLLLVGSTFQYGDVIVSRYFIPIATVLFCWFVFFITLRSINKFDLNVFLLHTFFCLMFIILSALGNSSYEEFVFDFVKVFFAFSVSFLAYYFLAKNNTKSIYKILLFMLYSAAVFLSLELFGRISLFEGDINTALSNFYLLKVISPFMVDSNAVGLYALFYFVVSLYLNNLKFFPYRKQNIFLMFVFLFYIMTTLSRAAIVAAFLILLLNIWMRIPRLIKFLFIPVATVFLVVGIYQIIVLVESDDSGLTKLNILKSIIDISPGLDFKGFMLGYGINEGNYVYSYQEGAYSHLLLPMVLGQFGLVGILFYFLFFSFVYYVSKGYVFVFFIAVFVVGLSYLHPFLETVFLVNGVLIGLFYHSEKMLMESYKY